MRSASAGNTAVWVAIIAFALNVGACGSEIMCSGIDSVDRGQRESAITLGFTERQDFFDFIFPQAAVTFLPVYRGELVTLLKGTSIYPIVIDAEYSEADGSNSMNFTWGGEEYNPIAGGDDLSSTIVRGLAKDIRYSRDEKNHLSVLF